MENKSADFFDVGSFKVASISAVDVDPVFKANLEAEDLLWSLNSENANDIIDNIVKMANSNLISYYLIKNTIVSLSRLRSKPNSYIKLLQSVFKEFSQKLNIPEKIASIQFKNRPEDSNNEIIFKDDLKSFRELAEKPDFNVNGRAISFYYMNSQTYLETAALAGSVNIFKYLIDKRAKFNNYINEYAVQGGNLEIINILREKGINFDNCFRAAMKNHNNKIADWLLCHFQCEKIDVKDCLLHSNIRMACFLIQNGFFDLEVRKYQANILSFGVLFKSLDIIKYFEQLMKESTNDIEVIIDNNEVSKMEENIHQQQKRKEEAKKPKVSNPNEPIYVPDSSSEEDPIENDEEEEEEDLSSWYFHHKKEIKYGYRYHNYSEQEEEEDEENKDNRDLLHPPLIYAIYLNIPEIISYFLEKWQNVDMETNFLPQDEFFGTAIKGTHSILSFAIKMKNMELVKKILQNGANINFIRRTSRSGWSLVNYTIKKNLLDFTRLLVSIGAPLNTSFGSDYTPLIYAIIKDNFDLVKLLVDSKADINARMYNSEWDTAINYAIVNNRYEMLEYLIQKGDKLNISPNIAGIPPLYVAIKFDRVNMVKLLIDKGANVDQEYFYEHRHLTPLCYAAYLGRTQIAKILIKAGADLNLRNPLGQAKRQNHREIVKLLEEA